VSRKRKQLPSNCEIARQQPRLPGFLTKNIMKYADKYVHDLGHVKEAQEGANG
jgi:hypothetical protein